jgi:phosphatidate cytidylyltransferase
MSNLIKDSSTRIKTALVLFLVFMLVSYLDIFFITWLFLGIFMIVGVSEAMKLFQVKSYIVYQIALISWLIAYFYKDSENLIFLALVIIASVLAYTKDIDKKTFLPLLYPLASFLILLSLYNEFGIQILWWILFIVATTDTGAYFIGKSIGKTNAGVIFGSLIGAIFAISTISYFQAFLISFIVAIASIFGDLFESYLKREAKVKDSGDILPGHGGVLDRTDGYLFASVVMLVVLRAAV